MARGGKPLARVPWIGALAARILKGGMRQLHFVLVLVAVGACRRVPPPPPPVALVPAQPEEKLRVSWRSIGVGARIVGGQTVAAVRLDAPRVALYRHRDEAPSRPFDLDAALRRVTPLELDRLDVHDGQVLWVDLTSELEPRLL